MPSKPVLRPLFSFSTRTFSTFTWRQYPGFFDLGARAASRENYHFSKQSGIPHIESSPSLQLLRAERDLAEKRKKELNGDIAKEEQDAQETKSETDPYSMFVGGRPEGATFTAPLPGTPATPASEDSNALRQQLAYLKKTNEQYRAKMMRMEEDAAERLEISARRDSWYKYLVPIALVVGLLGAFEARKWQARYNYLDKELDDTRLEVGNLKRERDHLNKVWYEKLKREGKRRAAEKKEAFERGKESPRGGWNLFWKRG